MTRRSTAGVLVALVAVLGGVLAPAGSAAELAAECAPPTDAPVLTIGRVDCLRFRSAALGGVSAFSYYIPPGCAGRECPVLYYLHGTGGSYREGTSKAWIAALTSGPPVDPRTQAAPWEWADPATWVAKPAIDMIIVAPHGLTLPGGFGPGPDQNPFWFDWNPRYAAGGDTPRYATPAPRFHDYLVHEVVPYVDAHFPTSGTREQRAIVGYSMGGIGSLANGLRHPDVFASIGARSGGGFPYGTADGVVPAGAPGVAPPVAVPYERLPGVVPAAAPQAAWDNVLYGSVATVGFGDPVVDQVWWRQTQPAELVSNAVAHSRDGRQSVHIQYFVNDAVPRRQDDLTGNPSALYFEAILMPTNLQLESRFERAGVERTFHLGPGLHSGPYAQPYFREQLEGQYARLRHADGGGDPPPVAATFSYRSIERSFSIWGWEFATERAATEFLYLDSVSCERLVARGSGRVTVTVAGRCGTGVDGQRTFTVDLGPSQPTDEPATGAVTSDGFGATRTVMLAPLRGPTSTP
jgi:S-formylglutathione hydrolase FrmB